MCARASTIDQISVHNGHRHRTFTDGRCTSLYRSVPHISGREHSRHTCPHTERLASQGPSVGAQPVTQSLGSSNELHRLVPHDAYLVCPVGMRHTANPDEYPARLHGSLSASRIITKRDRLQHIVS